MSARVIVVAGTASGVGKASITLGLLAARRRRGLRVQAFKVGPDEDIDGTPYPMVGLLPARVRMSRDRLTLGYREVSLVADGPLGPAGGVARGQEFHCSTLDAFPDRVQPS